MLEAATFARFTDVAFFPPPPNRPSRPDRRHEGGAGMARTLIRAFRRELAHVTHATGSTTKEAVR